MKGPQWLQDIRPGELSARVENLPLEKLQLGRQCLGETRLLMRLLLGLFLLSASVIVLGALAAGEHLVMGLVRLVMFLPVWGYFLARDLKAAWTDARQDSPALSWELCQRLAARRWVHWFAASVLLALTLQVALWQILYATGLLGKVGLEHDGLFYTLIFGSASLPQLATLQLAEALRALLGLLRGTSKKVTHKEPARAVDRREQAAPSM
ncbi:hypothetical protein Deipr_2388 (plasmid) [Deinococcus proteolyticus MRP]|uniref:Uncharacterized protein n=1 Tax=Deinococcus proteolyticus (strain ATCC 35074 / DSM 20540 / JCM 6276 / NBRC 101906 / NCIMB 13154 / VKM Ac-1939 / CCM 2703 / MRP) TaxID=693977 RepID=F0RQF3_DEIPM|nr:hypothetical protein [Deinococcus proteolyticus]ADY27512.1 hypothetical protein Deipr_2388 [Deinococcus proteolyticus MRP]